MNDSACARDSSRGSCRHRRIAPASGAGDCRKLIASLLLIAAFASLGCVSHQMYRETSVVEYPDYTLAFIEFDDRGEVWSPRQFIELQTLIRKLNQSELGVVVVLLVHGWNNNASPRNERKGTLAGFKQTLARVSEIVHEGVPGKPVVGVYLGWRGQSLYGPLKYLTFFSRQRAAARVGGTSGTAILSQIILDTKENPDSRMIVIGHSFGGQIIERLVQQGVASSILHVQEGPIPAAADLTVLLNPASPAINAKQVIDLLRWQMVDLERRAEDGRRWSAPILVSLTSEGDAVTRLAYPAGNLLGLWTSRFRKYGPEFCSPVTSQRDFYTRTAGHTPVLHSHSVQVTPMRPGMALPTPSEDGFVVAGEDLIIEVDRRHGAYNDTPYWIMRVPISVMAGHYDTWNPNLVSLVSGLLDATGALEENTKLHIVKYEGMDPVLLWPRMSGSLWLVDRTRRIFGVADARSAPVLVGCVPEGVDLANVIGHAGDATTLVIAQWRSDPRHQRTTEIVEIKLGPGGFRRIGETVLRSDEQFLHAAVDRPRKRVLLATADQLLVAEYGEHTARPEILAPLALAGSPIAMVLDPVRQRLLILDDGDGAVLEYDLLSSTPHPEVVARQLESPTAMAVDPELGHLYLVDAGSQSILQWQRIGESFDSRRVVTRYDGLREPEFLQVTVDGSLWVGDPMANKVFHFTTEGELIQVLE